MKTFATLLAILAIAAGANAANFSSTGRAETTIIGTGSDQCTQTLYYNHDNSFENGCCWQYGGIVPSTTYGAFGEGFSLGAGVVECMALWVTQVGNYFGQTCDTYVWEGGVSGTPGIVLWSAPGQAFTAIPYWPSCGQNNFDVNFCVSGDFTVGYWADFSAAVCAWYIALDSDGFGGYPWTNIAPGIGYPTGWNNPAIVWGAVQSLGFGVYFDAGGMTPVESKTWGEIKNLF
jgi:hypothetical protein